jgi:predicted dehydrogenase
MSAHRTAVVGTGRPPGETAQPGFSIGYAHGTAYREHPACDLVACADVAPDNAAAFAAEFDVADENVYEDYGRMLADVEPTLVSVCTPPEVHADIVVDCARSGHVDGIHCEKPMATTWGDCRRMVRECDRHDTQLTVNHQRRFAPRWRVARERLDAGEIGDVRRVEMAAPDLLDWGTHCFDLCGFYTGDSPPAWLMGQIHDAVPDFYGGAYDHHTESQALALWEYENGVTGLASTGDGTGALGGSEVYHRVVGTHGVVEVDLESGPRIRRHGESEWTRLEFAEENAHVGAIGDALSGLESGTEPELSARRALNATGLIFATWESARRRGRVDFPLDIDDNPLEALVERGAVAVRSDD